MVSAYVDLINVIEVIHAKGNFQVNATVMQVGVQNMFLEYFEVAGKTYYMKHLVKEKGKPDVELWLAHKGPIAEDIIGLQYSTIQAIENAALTIARLTPEASWQYETK